MPHTTSPRTRAIWRSPLLWCALAGLTAFAVTGTVTQQAQSDEDAAPSESEAKPDAAKGGCPFTGAGERHTAAGGRTYQDWWPNQLKLSVLHQNSPASNPMGQDFDYAKAFASIDLPILKKEIEKVLTTSQDWWPADYGHYGPLMIRLAWHSAGTYRITDGRGGATSGTIRFAPLNSWPDNGNLDKARRLLWPIKQKYGRNISWADLMILTGNVALESMGFETLGFAGGREDVWEPESDINWGPETEWLASKRHSGDRELADPLAATRMGLIYVNPEGPDGNPDPLLAAKDIRTTFARMAMNDEETVALIAGGHTLGKAHGAASPDGNVGAEPEGAPVEMQGLGWKNTHGKGNAEDTITSGLEGAWTSTPAQWSHEFFTNLFEFEWELTKSPAGAHQWTPKDGAGANTVPDAHRDGVFHAPMMLTTDLALRFDPIYGPISKRFYEDPKAFQKAFAKAWYKLTHRDMGPHSALVGSEVPEPQLWQDPVPAVDHPLVNADDVRALKAKVLASGLSATELVETAWASASTFRGTDRRGGANGARIRLAPQKDWAVNEPEQLAKVLKTLEGIQNAFNGAQADGKKISMADLIVLAGAAAVEDAAKRGGQAIEVPFVPGRTDATDAMTDAGSFAYLEPKADGFRNYVDPDADRPQAELLVDRAHKLRLSAPEMTALVGGLRVMGVEIGNGLHGVFTDRVGTLSNDYFVNLLSLDNTWAPKDDHKHIYQGTSRTTGKPTWTATQVDLVFGSHSQLRAIAEVYGSSDAQAKFVRDFVAAWTKVMQLDRFDLK